MSKMRRQLFSTIGKKYTEIEFLKFTGTQWFNTEIPVFNFSNWEIDLKFKPNRLFNYNPVFGTESGLTTHECWFEADADFFVRYNASKQQLPDVNTSTIYEMKFKYSGGRLTVEMNGSQVLNVSIATSLLDSSFYLFHRTGAAFGELDFYYAKIFTDGTLRMDLIPVIDKNGVKCALNKVDSSFLYSSGGVFNE